MRTSQYLLATVKETPKDAELISHQLMIRAGMIRKLASGLYTWMPLGLRVLKKVEAIVREEMEHISAQELLMPAVQPAELWQESDRWDAFGPQLLKFKDRHDRDFCFGPTHEEVITDLLRHELKSYKQVPCCFFQIQTKFRDEIRPRFGIMRSREFIMKDAYSFDMDKDGMEQSYEKMYEAYTKIFSRLGFQFRAVLADTGAIGGAHSHEFHVLADSGEDAIAFCPQSDYAANLEMATYKIDDSKPKQPSQDLSLKATPNIKKVSEQAAFMGLETDQIVKTLLLKGTDQPVVAVLLRGDDELNAVKAEKSPLIASPLTMASEEEVLETAGCKPGFVGPKDLNIPIIADHLVIGMHDFSCGANQDDHHYIGVNWARDLPIPEHVMDLRTVKAGDPSPDGKGSLEIARGIEVGHIFQLGDKYNRSMHATVLDEKGKHQYLEMGCYGIGVSRIIAAAIEQNHDEHGIIWNDVLSPFQIAIVPMHYHKSHRVQEASEKLYQALTEMGFDVLLDNRKERPGVIFNDLDLIGIPHRIVVGERGLDSGLFEYKHRAQKEAHEIKIDEVLPFLKDVCK